MRNVFKIFFLALAASSIIFVSCKKDDKKDDKTVSKVTFGNKEWNIAKADGVCYIKYDEIQAAFFADSVKKFPHAYIDANTKRGAYSAIFDTAKFDYKNDNILAVQYWTNGLNVEIGGETIETGDFWAKNVSYVVDSFDATGATISFKLNADMFDVYETYTNHWDVNNAATTKMTILAIDQTVKADTSDYGKAMPASKIVRPASLKGAKFVK